MIAQGLPVISILIVLFFSALIRSTIGFGDALIAMPLLALLVRLQIASPVVAFMGVVISMTMLVLNWQKVDLQSTKRLVLSSLVGIPVGLFLLANLPEVYVKALLGVILILFGVYNLAKPDLPEIRSKALIYIMGFLGGILGGAYNSNGPPIIVYGKLARWSPERFRATLQSYFLPTGVFVFIGHGLAGAWTHEVVRLFAFSFPLILGGIFIGTFLSKYISGSLFDRVVYASLIVMGALMFL